MNPQVHVEEHLEMETEVQATVTETDMLAQCGMSAEEIVALLWLRQWSQMRSLMYEERQVIARRLSHSGLWAEPQVRDRPEEQDRFQRRPARTIEHLMKHAELWVHLMAHLLQRRSHVPTTPC